MFKIQLRFSVILEIRNKWKIFAKNTSGENIPIRKWQIDYRRALN